ASALRALPGGRHLPPARSLVAQPASRPRWKLPRPSPLLRRTPAIVPAEAPCCTPGLQGSGSRFVGPASSSSLLFSCTRIKSLVHLPLDRLAERVLAFFMEGHALHRNLFDLAVVQLVALAQKVRPLLGIGHHRYHSVRRFHDAVQTQRAHLQAGFARRKVL